MKRLACVAALTMAAGSAPAQVFERLVTSPFAPTPVNGIHDVFDIDGDGLPDALASDAWYRNEGFGRYVYAGDPGQVGSTGPSILGTGDIGDLDGDGDLDMVAGNLVYENLGDGTFAPTPAFLSPSLSVGNPRLLDYDGDGDIDILHDVGGATLWQNDGAGNFSDASATLIGLDLAISGATVFDADNDGDEDVLVISPTLQPIGLRLWRNDGAGGFGEELLPPFAGLNFGTKTFVGDLDGDGDQDVVLVLLSTLRVRFLINDGFGAFVDTQPGPGAPGIAEVGDAALGDWTQDGLIDIVTGNGVFENLGGLAFTFHAFPHMGLAASVRLCDLDGDLDLDALLPSSSNSVIFNTLEGPIHGTRQPTVKTRALGQLFDARDTPFARALVLDDLGLSLVSDFLSDISDPAYRTLTSSPVPTATAPTDAAIARASFLPHTIVVCTPTGAESFVAYDGDVSQVQYLLPPIGAPSHVAAGALDATYPDVLAFGDPTLDGPRVLIGPAAFAQPYTELPLALPPAQPSPAPVFETVTFADVDGDGDDDLVHELRVVENLGGGAFAAGFDLSSLVSTQTEHLLPIDYDGDGDMDLLAYGENAPTLLLESGPAGFLDATIGHLPPIEFAPADLVSAGDVDGDGDTDLLIARGTSCNLLRNGGGVFTRIANVGPRGLLLDTDRNGYPDLFTGDDVLRNRHALLHEVHAATPGITWPLQVHAFRAAPMAQAAWIALGTQPAGVVLPGIGTLGVDPTAAELVPVVMAGGEGSATWTIPLTPLALGLDLFAQALIADASGLTLTNTIRDRVR